jgi:CTP synthase (UTP-ammonia lyase)
MIVTRRQGPPEIRIAVIGDFVAGHPSRQAANEALGHAADALRLSVGTVWIPTTTVASEDGCAVLEQCDAVFAPEGAYDSKDGALATIRFARERGWPFFGT